MKLKPLQKSIYNISTVVFLVLALSLISIITSITNRNSEKLSVVVTHLAENKFEIDQIDKAIQLLYKAENNSRLYVVTRDAGLYADYMDQLNQVSALIISVQKDDEKRIGGLVQDKKLKTELYINAKLLADSLLRNTSIATSSRNVSYGNTPVLVEAPTDTSSTIKVVEEYVVEKKSKKGLFGRIKDAIANKPNEKELKTITTFESQENEAAEQAIASAPKLIVQRQQPDFAKLTKQEKALLVANSELFESLQELLVSLKVQEIRIQEQRQLDLGNNAAVLMGDLKSNNKYSLILSLLLTVVILSVLVLLYRNMQSLQLAKLKAEEHAKYKSRFAATLSHEIRTPLHSIHAFTDELSKKSVKEEESEIIDAIKLSSNMLISVVNNILDFTKMESGKFKLDYLPFTPSIIIHEVIQGLAIQAKRKNLTLYSELDTSTEKKVYGDAFQFRQLLVNIINNAIKYTDKGSISIVANLNPKDQMSGMLKVSVKDTGIGISTERLLYIFDEYHSQQGNNEIKEGSTGLGLSIVKKIVDYHEGEIEVDSELGRGTTFIVTLPYDIFKEKDAESKIATSNPFIPKILIIENEPLNLKILNLIFDNENYKVMNASDGIDAFEKFVHNDFDLILTDIAMPGLNGFELAQKIRELPNPIKAAVPILAISGFDEPDSQENSLSFIDAWLVKPFDTDVLLAKVEELCSGSFSIEQNN